LSGGSRSARRIRGVDSGPDGAPRGGAPSRVVRGVPEGGRGAPRGRSGGRLGPAARGAPGTAGGQGGAPGPDLALTPSLQAAGGRPSDHHPVRRRGRAARPGSGRRVVRQAAAAAEQAEPVPTSGPPV